MEIKNDSYIFGDGNIDLQNISNSNITINYSSDTRAEVKAKKQIINDKLSELIRALAQLERAQRAKEVVPQVADDDLFEDIEWDDLVDSIKLNNCVVFFGPEISTDENGVSLHEKFNNSISSKKLEYNPQDGFFMPGTDKTITEKQIKLKLMSYYANQFLYDNTRGYQIVEKIAKIPLPLLVSIAPDETLHRVFHDNNMPHDFFAYNAKEQTTDQPTIEKPIIYNLLGSPVENGMYIFTHEHFYNYMHKSPKIRVPLSVENTISDAIHYLFIGINFNKWYNRLLMFSLDVQAEGYSCFSDVVDETNQTFIQQQFKITSVPGNYEKFTDTLLAKCMEKGVYKPLYRYFFEQTLAKVAALRLAAMKTDNEGDLQEITNSIEILLNETTNKLNYGK